MVPYDAAAASASSPPVRQSHRAKKRAPEGTPEVRIGEAIPGGTKYANEHGCCFEPVLRPRTGHSPRIIHFVFDRMGRVLETDHLGHLEVDIGVDEVIVEYTAGLEERAIGVEAGQRLAE
jgi:hypothetical protein